jgi:predicted hotdog family 3-hydroxylacyl-ACP dehydratase
MDLSAIDIEDLLAHRDRMLLIKQVVALELSRAVTRAVVTDRWPLSDTRGANPLVLIELVAQTAGIHNGWRLRQEQGPGADHRGWLVGIKNARFFMDNLPFKTEIVTEARNEFEFEGYREIRGVAAIKGETAAEIILQLVQADSKEP